MVKVQEPVQRSESAREKIMTQAAAATPDQDDADRHHQVHRLPRVPGGVQAVERSRRGRDGTGADLGFQNPATLSAKTLTLDHVPRAAQREGARRAALPLHDAALPALPGAGLRLGVPDDRAGAPARRTCQLRCRQMHRLPLLHLGVSVGRTDHRMGLAHAEDPEVHALRRSLRSAAARSRNGQALTEAESKLYRDNIAIPLA